MPMRYLKLQDDLLLEFEIEKLFVINVHDAERLPVALRGFMPVDCMVGDREMTMEEEIDAISHINSYLRNRTLDTLRANYKAIVNHYNIPQNIADTTIFQIIDKCKGASVIDDYWITDKLEDKWENVSPRLNKINEAVANLGLSGSTRNAKDKYLPLELTTQGSFAKAWFKDKNGDLILYKANGGAGSEVNAEVDASYILDNSNVPHVKYWKEKKQNLECCACRSIVNENHSIVPAFDVVQMFRHYGENPDKVNDLAIKLSADIFYKMVVVDYLISNSDRHLLNWGFYQDNRTGELMSLHPLFDHNNALDKEEMRDKDGGKSYIFAGKSKLEAARYALKRCEFKMINPIDKKAFLNREYFDSFKEKAAILNVPVEEKSSIFSFFS